MPHDRPSLRCTLSDWCEQPRWRGQKPWTVGELRHTPGRRTIQIHQTRSQVVLVSGGVVQSQQHNNSLSPVCTALGGEQNITGKSTVRASRATQQDGTAWMFKSYDSLVSMDTGRGEKRSILTRPTCKEMQNACGNGGIQTPADASTKSNYGSKAHQTQTDKR